MSEHDDNLSRFFQKASKEPEIEFNESDWQKLDARLDEEGAKLPSKLWNWSRTGIAIFLIALLFTSTIYFYTAYEKELQPNDKQQNRLTSNSNIQSDSVNIVAQQPTATSRALISTSDSIVALEYPNPAGDNVADKADQSQAYLAPTSILTQSKNAEKNTFAERNEVSNLSDTNGSILSVTNTSNDFNPPSNIGSATQQNTYSEAQNNVQLTQESELNNESSVSSINSERLIVSQHPQLDSSTQALAEMDSTIIQSDSTNKNFTTREKEKPRLQDARWSFVAFYAPDFSTIGRQEYTTPGEAFGLSVHYHFKNRWSASTGIIKSNKKYIGSGTAYQPPAGYWERRTNGVVPQEVEGECSVIEVPLSIQYNVARFKHSNLLISAGISSYFMRNESYSYSFEYSNPGADNSWVSQNPTRFLLSIANLSVGYERMISPKVTIGIEPYVKIPLADIGWSNVKLFSTGASITFRYKILKNKSSYSDTPIRSPD